MVFLVDLDLCSYKKVYDLIPNSVSSCSREDIHSVHGGGFVAHAMSRARRLHRKRRRRASED